MTLLMPLCLHPMNQPCIRPTPTTHTCRQLEAAKRDAADARERLAASQSRSFELEAALRTASAGAQVSVGICMLAAASGWGVAWH